MKIRLLFGCLLLAACTRTAPSSAVSDSTSNNDTLTAPDEKLAQRRVGKSANLIDCSGIGQIRLSDNLVALENKIGKENLSRDSLMLEGMFEGFITVAYKNTSREVKIYWKEKQPPYRNIRMLEITRPDSPYRFANGLGIGTSLQELVKLNSDIPVSLYGFAWDYGGTLISFNNGSLSKILPCFSGVFDIQTLNGSKQERQIMGDRPINSGNPVLKQYQVRLAKIRLLPSKP